MRSFSLARTALAAAALAASAAASVVQYDFSIEWVYAAPDGYNRSVIGVNGVWPPPTLFATVGDNVIVNLTNNLGNEDTSLHFHGMFQNTTNSMDGPPMVTQCEIPPGSNFIYNFTVNQPGMYWYHSHTSSQYPDGLRAPFVVYDPDDPYVDDYDYDEFISLSEWYHDSAVYLTKYEFLTLTNPTGSEPVPDSILLNDTQDFKISVEAGKTYKFRIVNIGAFVSQYIYFEGHNMTIIEVDGIYVEPQVVSMIYITVAQRYTVLITMKNDTTTNYPFMTSFDTDMLDTTPDTLMWNSTGWLVYNEDADLPDMPIMNEWDFYDDFYLVPLEKEEPWEVDSQITVVVTMQNLNDGANYAFFDNISYVAPLVPTLYSVMSTGANATVDTVYGTNTHTYIAEHLDVIEIVLNSQDPGKHPFHLHGHVFQVIERSEGSDDDTVFIAYDPEFPGTINEYPMKRDTVYVRPNGYFRIRFIADNPGVWFFHCHIEWHLEQGLALQFVEAPLLIQERVTIPDDHYAACEAAGTSYEGNAAGNTVDLYDLTGEPVQVDWIPAGFTARGIVAMVFSCVSAFVGMGFITWYGLSDLKTTEAEVEQVFAEEEAVTEESNSETK
ncbi:Cupredoxin [Limtongia smithiae]|uniref:Cupredoxin n=1 Tax=Limtongia smithiae TaxID=1125753 RepID=UPI0034CFE681